MALGQMILEQIALGQMAIEQIVLKQMVLGQICIVTNGFKQKQMSIKQMAFGKVTLNHITFRTKNIKLIEQITFGMIKLCFRTNNFKTNVLEVIFKKCFQNF
jgi:hypothetical protein